MEPLSTTTTGLSDSVTTMSPFHIMSAEKTIMARLSSEKESARLLRHMLRSDVHTSTAWSRTNSMAGEHTRTPQAARRWGWGVAQRRPPVGERVSNALVLVDERL
jgi:hypothetical protein